MDRDEQKTLQGNDIFLPKGKSRLRGGAARTRERNRKKSVEEIKGYDLSPMDCKPFKVFPPAPRHYSHMGTLGSSHSFSGRITWE